MGKPLPRPNAETQPFWDGCAQGRLRYQVCGKCATVQLIPRSFCSTCQAAPLQWRDSAGAGTVLSYTTVQRAPIAAFKEDVPYGIAIIDMDEGFRLMVNVNMDILPALKGGSRVRIGLKEVEGMKLPHAEALL